MNKDDLSKAIYEVHGGISFAEARKIVDLILDLIKGKLRRGEKVLISGFGCFRVVKRRDRQGINPRTGASIAIPGRRAVVFKLAKSLKSISQP